MTIFDIFTIGGGIVLLVAPNWAYNAFRKEKVEVPPGWPLKSRIFGGIFIAAGLLFLYLNFTR